MKSNQARPTVSLGFGISGAAKKPAAESGREGPAGNAKILLVDSDVAEHRLMKSRLEAASYTVETVNDAQAALHACVRSRPDLVIADLRLSDSAGLDFLKELKGRWPQLSVIIVTSHGSIPEAVQATQCGAFGYLVKPVEKTELLGQVQRAIADAALVFTPAGSSEKIVSRSQQMLERLAIANRAARCDEPVLLTGEQGTGKELLARAIHAASERRAMPFVSLSCRDRPGRALKAELFGRDGDESADPQQPEEGALQRARGGTLLLENIDELPVDLQAVLARELIKGPITARQHPQPRLICTTSRDLRQLAGTGAFLEALYFEIAILPIEIPPLGRRREDIPLLVSHFLEQATEPGTQRKMYTPEAIELLATTDWPGNVRQLFDIVKQHVALSHGGVMSKEFVQKSLGDDSVRIPTFDEAREKFSRDYLVENLQRTAGNVSHAARLAKRNRTDFYKLMARYQLQPDDFKDTSDEAATGERRNADR